MDKEFTVDKDNFSEAANSLADTVAAYGTVWMSFTTEKPKKKYSAKQRGSLHLWCEFVAKTFNDAGIIYGTRVKFSGQQINIDWNMQLVKQDVYKPLLEAMTGKLSTEDQDSIDPSAVALELNRHFAEKYGITLPEWPSHR